MQNSASENHKENRGKELNCTFNSRVKTYLLYIFLLLSFFSFAQRDSVELDDGTILYNLPETKPPKNAFYIEAFGNGGIYSFNYDRILVNKKKFRTSIRGGFSLMPFPSDHNFDLIFIAEHNFLFGTEKHFAETGLGITYAKTLQAASGKGSYFDYISEQAIGVVRLGYRYQPRMDKGIFFRTGLTPFILQTNEHDQAESIFQFWLGIGAGANF